MKHAFDAARPSRSRRARVALPGLLLVAGALTLSACATPVAGASPSPTASATASASPTPTASPSETAAPEPTPTESATADAPYNGEVLVITSEVRDGNLEVTAMVPGVSESGGTCTLTLDDTQASVSVSANEGKDVTYCGVMSIAVDTTSADVAFHVGYSSSNLRAQSETATIELAP